MALIRVRKASYRPMRKTLAPRVWRYFGTKRIHSHSQVAMIKIAIRVMTRLRLSAKKSANCFPRFVFGSVGVSMRNEVSRAQSTQAGRFGELSGTSVEVQSFTLWKAGAERRFGS